MGHIKKYENFLNEGEEYTTPKEWLQFSKEKNGDEWLEFVKQHNLNFGRIGWGVENILKFDDDPNSLGRWAMIRTDSESYDKPQLIINNAQLPDERLLVELEKLFNGQGVKVSN